MSTPPNLPQGENARNNEHLYVPAPESLALDRNIISHPQRSGFNADLGRPWPAALTATSTSFSRRSGGAPWSQSSRRAPSPAQSQSTQVTDLEDANPAITRVAKEDIDVWVDGITDYSSALSADDIRALSSEDFEILRQRVEDETLRRRSDIAISTAVEHSIRPPQPETLNDDDTLTLSSKTNTHVSTEIAPAGAEQGNEAWSRATWASLKEQIEECQQAFLRVQEKSEGMNAERITAKAHADAWEEENFRFRLWRTDIYEVISMSSADRTETVMSRQLQVLSSDLRDLVQNLQEAFAIAVGERKPYEEEIYSDNEREASFVEDSSDIEEDGPADEMIERVTATRDIIEGLFRVTKIFELALLAHQAQRSVEPVNVIALEATESEPTRNSKDASEQREIKAAGRQDEEIAERDNDVEEGSSRGETVEKRTSASKNQQSPILEPVKEPSLTWRLTGLRSSPDHLSSSQQEPSEEGINQDTQLQESSTGEGDHAQEHPISTSTLQVANSMTRSSIGLETKQSEPDFRPTFRYENLGRSDAYAAFPPSTPMGRPNQDAFAPSQRYQTTSNGEYYYWSERESCYIFANGRRVPGPPSAGAAQIIQTTALRDRREAALGRQGVTTISVPSRAPQPSESSRDHRTVARRAVMSIPDYEYHPNREIEPSTEAPRPFDRYNQGLSPITSTRQAVAKSAAQTAPRQRPVHKNIRGTEGEYEQLDSRYRKRPQGFFKPGRVFKVRWAEPSGKDPADPNATVVTPRKELLEREFVNPEYARDRRFGGWIYSKIRCFIVVRQGNEKCACVPIVTYNGQGVAKAGIVKGEHAIAYVGRDPPSPRRNEAPAGVNERPLRTPIRITPDERGDVLENMSRIDYGRVYTVEHNVKAMAFGWVHASSEKDFQYNWRNVFMNESSSDEADSDDQDTVPQRETDSSKSRQQSSKAKQQQEDAESSEDEHDSDEEPNRARQNQHTSQTRTRISSPQ